MFRKLSSQQMEDSLVLNHPQIGKFQESLEWKMFIGVNQIQKMVQSKWEQEERDILCKKCILV